MRPGLFAGALLALGCAAPAVAAEPQPCADDPRLECIVYRPNEVVRLYAAAGATLRIQLAAGEAVEGLLVSDQRTLARDEPEGVQEAALGSQGGKAVPTCDPNLCRAVVGNFVYLMPRRELAPQPFFLQGRWCETGGACHETPYAFELLTRPAPAQPGASSEAPAPSFYGVRFLYPEREAAEKQRAQAAKAAAWRAAHPPAPKLAPPTPSTPEATANWKYAYRGAAAVKPDAVWDDGRTTFLRYDGNRRTPNVYGFLPDGTETNGFGYAAEPGADGTILRIGKTDRRWCVRDGDRSGCLYNLGADPEGRNVPTVAPAAAPTPLRSAAR